MSDWRETDGDEWGPTLFELDCSPYPPDQALIDEDGLMCDSPLPLAYVRALLRANDLRIKAPGTECRAACCDGGRLRNDLGYWRGECYRCHGSGRNLTKGELERWRGRRAT